MNQEGDWPCPPQKASHGQASQLSKQQGAPSPLHALTHWEQVPLELEVIVLSAEPAVSIEPGAAHVEAQKAS